MHELCSLKLREPVREWNSISQKYISRDKYPKIMLFITILNKKGVISAGVSVPVQIPSHGPDLSSNYWSHRLQ